MLEGHASARAGLAEERDDRLTPERGDLLDVPVKNLVHRVRVLEDGLDLVPPEVVQVQHVASAGSGSGRWAGQDGDGGGKALHSARPGHDSPFLRSRTLSTPSTSTKRTSISSSIGRGDVLADVVRPYGELPMAPIDQDRKLYLPGPSKVGQRVHGGPDAAPRVEYVVHEHDPPPTDVDRYVGRLHQGPATAAEVIPVGPDIESADSHLTGLEPLDPTGKTVSDWNAPRVHADQYDPFGAAVPLEDLVCNPCQGSSDLLGGEYAARPAVGCHQKDLSPSGKRSRLASSGSR